MPINFENGTPEVMMSYVSGQSKMTKRAMAVVTSTNGAATINLTTDGTPTGPAIFKNIFGISVSPMVNTTTVTDVGRGSPRSLSADNKQLVVQATRGNSVTLLGLTVLTTDRWVADGTKMYVTVDGE